MKEYDNQHEWLYQSW